MTNRIGITRRSTLLIKPRSWIEEPIRSAADSVEISALCVVSYCAGLCAITLDGSSMSTNQRG